MFSFVKFATNQEHKAVPVCSVSSDVFFKDDLIRGTAIVKGLESHGISSQVAASDTQQNASKADTSHVIAKLTAIKDVNL